ncbi:MAG: phosphoribosylaminoimidazolesuccinocarboxamide synthase [Oscillospiraceae bacterium]|jgi:phosphoribosylaminoimidazole-succinocarboxamide synthase|nr:phosphoribosylaminoimidazolesuccinocarboxamide synthase [Oscillospiraceae bacterium]
MKKLVSGKVRDVYEVSDGELVIVTTDRISAFDVILPKPVEGKGKVLNAISLFWFDFTGDIVPNHILSADPGDMPEVFRKPEFEGRTVLVKRLEILPFEFIVRGYMFGNMWRAYSRNEEFCGHRIKDGYALAEKLDVPILTPSTKAHTGHDEYISFGDVGDAVGTERANGLKETCLKLYDACYRYAYGKGIIIADTKFEFGLDRDGNLFLADEIFTPDSSRFWSLAEYRTGVSPKSYDKQLVRDWLLNNQSDGGMRFGSVPDDILKKTAEIYGECLKKITG